MQAGEVRCTGYTRRAAERRRNWYPHVPLRLPRAFHVPLESVTYNQDGLLSIHNAAFAYEPKFGRAYAEAKATGSWSGPWGQADIHWRAHVLCWAGLQASRLNGDFVECGVNMGGTALLLLEYLEWREQHGKTFYLYDTFEGLDRAVSSERELAQTREVYKPCFEDVQRRFLSWPNVILVQGSIPDSLLLRSPQHVAYLHIDLNAAKPERAALEFFWDRLVPGAWIVFDDYAWVACAEQKAAIDRAARHRGCDVLSLPTGQGLLVKPM